ncbi:MAG TPA: relaxase/mobilization nuclease domain-containing protein [Candidatus Binataceae bacterium]|nr:relaxase/mobilization nuclease domain-containing protein [Candidatus Binataceae bacterium]
MIPFGSQRALGQDLATHLLNAQDNERMEVAQVRGAVARDLHGAFAEWEAQAHTLTRCSNYLYSLSVNPDQRQGRLTREQYLDYIDRVENRIGLAGQPRAIVFHVKKDKNGIPREHCHVIWSRIDAERGKARQIAFDHDKLMMVTREFARDHGLKLPDGYYRDKGQERPQKNRQLSLYEKSQQDRGGLSKEQHMAQVTAAWQKRDTPRAFVRSLEDMGYILATGTRDYVLIDLYGNMNSLPKLIDDKKVRTKDLREFLGKEFPKDSLPSVDEARALASARRAAMELFRKDEDRAAREAMEKERREALQRKHQDRRAPVEQESKGLEARQRQDRGDLATRQKEGRAALRQGYLQESKRIRLDRATHRPKGLAAFLGRITGVALITKKVQQYRDKTRYDAFVAQKRDLTERQQRESAALVRRLELENLSMQRRLRALELVEQRELRSLENALLKERRIEERERTSRESSPEPHTDVFNKAAKKPIDLSAEFARAAQGGEGEGEASGESAQDLAPEAEVTIQRRKRTKDRSQDVERSARSERSARDTDNGGPSGDDPAPRRRRNRDLDRGR